MRKTKNAGTEEVQTAEVEQKVTKRPSRSRKKAVAPVADETPVVTDNAEVAPEKTSQEAPVAEVKTEPETEKVQPAPKAEPVKKPIPALPHNVVIRDFPELLNSRIPLLNDQQIQQLTLAEAAERHLFFEAVLTQVLDYDVVLSDTNIWLELLVGHTSSHSDPRVNARLMFERQLEFISRLIKKKGGRFMIMSETYEEIDRFACQQEPTNYQQADFTDEVLCRNVAARLAKRLILSQQRENRLRIEGICSESHHAAFADPAIIRRVVDLFASGRKVLLLTNDASVAIRSLGMCDDLQRINKIDDQTWDRVYAPIRPMACTMDDLKQLDNYTRQYHYLMQAAGATWMQDLAVLAPRPEVEKLQIDENLFRPGDKHERRSDRQAQERAEQQRKEQQKLADDRKQAQQDIQRAQQEMQKLQAEQKKIEQQRQQLQNEQRNAEQRRKNEERRAEEQQRRNERRNRQQSESVATETPAESPVVESAAPVQDAPAPAPVAAPAAQKEEVPAAPVALPAVAATPAESAPTAASAESAPAPAAQVESSPVETVVPQPLPGFSPEDLELITPSAPKKRVHRGGRRRGGNNKPQE